MGDERGDRIVATPGEGEELLPELMRCLKFRPQDIEPPQPQQPGEGLREVSHAP